MSELPAGEPQPNESARWPLRLLLAAVLAFVVVSRFWHLGDRPLHHDESLFAFYAWGESQTGTYNAGGYDRYSPDGTPAADSPPGTPTHHPLLHGPLQMELVGAALYTADTLGILGSDTASTRADAVVRTVAATCAVLLFFVLAGMRRDLGGALGLALAALALAVSPELWFYGRFCRNEPIFTMVTLAWVAALARCWRLPRVREAERDAPAAPAAASPEAPLLQVNPGAPAAGGVRSAGWVLAACLLSAVLVALKENSLFLLFNAATFWVLFLVYQQWGARGNEAGAAGRWSPWRLAWHYKFAWIGGLALGWLVLETVYTNHFAWKTSFVEMYRDILHYWGGQHSEHRLYGEYHYYLPILALYEPVAMAVLAVAGARLFAPWRRPVAAALLLLAVVMGLWIAIKGFGYIEALDPDAAPGRLLKKLHMTSPAHLALACGLGWTTLCGAWHCLRQGRRFRAFLVWWAGLGILQYGYAGEKVPWVTVHQTLPCLLLAANLVGEACSGALASRVPKGRAAAAALLALWLAGCAWNAVQGYRVCFVHPTYPGERLIYNHTQPEVQALGREMRQMALAPLGKPGSGTPMFEGEVAWPLLWYLHGADYIYTSDAAPLPAGLERVPLIACDENYLSEHPSLKRQYDIQMVPFRQAWVPDTLYLLSPLSHALLERDPNATVLEPRSDADREFLESRRPYYGLGAWKTLFRYVIDPERKPWGDPDVVAQPLKIAVGRRKATPLSMDEAPLLPIPAAASEPPANDAPNP